MNTQRHESIRLAKSQANGLIDYAARESALSPLAVRILAFIREKNGAGEGEILSAFWPEPQFPANPSEADKEYWRTLSAAWRNNAFSGNGVEYRDCYASLRSQACIELSRAGLIREHNNGFNDYYYTPSK
jgi:hypothetical protein